MKQKNFTLRLLAVAITGVLSLTLSETSFASTIYVSDYGSTGIQNYSYTFADDFSGTLILGVSDQGDTEGTSFLDVGKVHLNTNPTHPVSTSVYQNTLGESGTDGQFHTYNISVFQGSTLSFNWTFHTEDYVPFHDFAFAQLNDTDLGLVNYTVLAQIGTAPSAVPVPAAIWLFGSAIAGFAGIARRKIATV